MPEDGQQIYDALGHAIQRARKAAKRTQQSVADAAGIADQTTLSDYERGRSRIPLDVLRRIEAALDLTPGQLLIDSELVAAKQVPVNTSTQQAINDDHDLDEDAKHTMLFAYDYCVRVSVVDRDTPSPEAVTRAVEAERVRLPQEDAPRPRPGVSPGQPHRRGA